MIRIRPTGIGLLQIEHVGPRNVVGAEYVTEGGCHTVILAVPRGVRVRNAVVGQRHGIRVVAEALTDVARGPADFRWRSRDTAVRCLEVGLPFRNV